MVVATAAGRCLEIRQEIYAALCVYQAIRTLICTSAQDAGLEPDPISFTCAKNAIAARVSHAAAFSPADLDDLQADVAAEITYRRHLVPLRPPRSYVRSQERPGGRFPTKKPGERPRTKVIFWTLPQRT